MKDKTKKKSFVQTTRATRKHFFIWRDLDLQLTYLTKTYL